jgi:hypothetical protein
MNTDAGRRKTRSETMKDMKSMKKMRARQTVGVLRSVLFMGFVFFIVPFSISSSVFARGFRCLPLPSVFSVPPW